MGRSDAAAARGRRWQGLTLASLITGYAGYYLNCVEQIFELFDGRGDAEYFGEPVSKPVQKKWLRTASMAIMRTRAQYAAAIRIQRGFTGISNVSLSSRERFSTSGLETRYIVPRSRSASRVSFTKW